jgi:hypothetical protein
MRGLLNSSDLTQNHWFSIPAKLTDDDPSPPEADTTSAVMPTALVS